MFSDHDETSPSIAAVSAPSAACSMLAVQQQKRLCRIFAAIFIEIPPLSEEIIASREIGVNRQRPNGPP